MSNANIVRRGTGIPLIFIHGLGCDHRLLLDLDDAFATPSQWERIYLDLPGFGNTPALTGRGGLPDLADWLNDVVGELVGDSPFAVVGNSMGGILARDLASRRSDQCLGMALLAPVVDPVHQNRALPQMQLLELDEAFIKSINAEDAEVFKQIAPVQTADTWKRFEHASLPGLKIADADAVARIEAHYEIAKPEDGLEGYAGDVLIIAGRQDAVVGFEDQYALAARFQRSSYAALDRCGHNVHLDQPEATRGLLRNWAQAITSRAR